MPLAAGYGSREDNTFGERGLWQMRWALAAAPPFDYYLRVDDDSFLCLHKLRAELAAYPPVQFRRIDAQQGELTTYMHTPDATDRPAVYASFCERYLYAHHVSAAVATAAAAATRLHPVYSEVAVGAGGVRCPAAAGAPTFLASRHSARLPNVQVTQL
ncbi:hypothetical protein I4F81_008712 [Pyropia yezoensis]|uniref:Uncharacterized protein n=1 Tax=Pyropia yezoensis TaxID=2788 RepID=A0ACC3C7N4_PYRYE|nr:hypothetical protein I4F81_008712 [Neopyropia yezoensis]